MNEYCSYTESSLSSLTKVTQDMFMDEKCELGRGANGVVYRGYSRSKNKNIAMKCIPNIESQREIQTLQYLSELTHQYIMQFYGSVERGDVVYLFLEYCPHGTLTEAIAEGLTEEEILRMFRQIVEGMGYINARNKMHRDLKPDNIMLGIDKKAKICDFGLARENSKDITITGLQGTPMYAAPQIFNGELMTSYSLNCDVWSGGAILYQMLTGKPLFYRALAAESNEEKGFALRREWVLFKDYACWISLPPNMHPNWECFLNKMLRYEKKKRCSYDVILRKLQQLYDKMKLQLSNKCIVIKKQNTKSLIQFSSYEIAKYDILLKTCEIIMSQQIEICQEQKYALMYVCMCRYLAHMKQFLFDMEHNKIIVEGSTVICSDNEIEFAEQLDIIHTRVENKFVFCSKQLQNEIVSYIKKSYAEIKSKEIYDKMNIMECVQDELDYEKIYVDLFYKIMKQFIQQGSSHMHFIPSTKTYWFLLTACTLDFHLPSKDYKNIHLVDAILKKYSTATQTEMYQELSKMENIINAYD